jgi:hypothetical protein
MDACKIFIELGKGSKERYILFWESFRLILKPGRPTSTLAATARVTSARHWKSWSRLLWSRRATVSGLGSRACGLPARRPEHGIEQLPIGGTAATLISFTHPSAHGALNWGLNEKVPHLLTTVAPTIARVTGDWQASVEASQGSSTPTIVLQQQGEKVTGTFNSQIFGEAKITGTVKGNAIEFGFEGDAGGQTIKVTYKGTIESPTTMKSTAVYVGFDDNATWSATKK